MEQGPGKHLVMFREGARERLRRLNLAWIRFEQGGASAEARVALLRELHTLKGEAGLMLFAAVASVVHAIEDLIKTPADGTRSPGDVGDVVLAGLDLATELVERAPDAPAPELGAYVEQVRPLLGPAAASVAALAAPAAPEAPQVTAETPVPDALHAAEAIRVTPEKLDRIRDIVGELLLVQRRLDASAAEVRRVRELTLDAPQGGQGRTADIADVLTAVGGRLKEDGHQVARLVHELDRTTRALRMLPIGTLFERYPRAVRQLARELGREVRLEIRGEAVEVDRVVLDRIAEPILHLVRNAVDHGIEPPEVRRAAGKPAEGRIELIAMLAGRSLHVEIVDDGAGIDVERVRAKAVELGLFGAELAPTLPESEVLRCLFDAGMSTRATASEHSGRGIGLNVVLENVEQLGGHVNLATHRGAGTTFVMKVPLTVAITSVLLFRVGGGHYALPTASVEAVLDESQHPLIESTQGQGVRYKDAWVPVVPLRQLLDEEEGQPGDRRLRILIVRSTAALVALPGIYDLTEQEAVLKSAGRLFDKQRLVGAAVPLADGSVALVLKAGELHAAVRVVAGTTPRSRERARGERQVSVLVVDDSPLVRDLVAETLRAHGLRIIEASDGEEALQQLDRHDVRLVVTDIEMPRLDGVGLIQRVRARGGRRLPMVVVSMRGSAEDKRRALEAGADAYLVKSDLTHGDLWGLVARFLA